MTNLSAIASTVLPGHIENLYLKCVCELSLFQITLYEGDRLMWFSTNEIKLN